MNLVAEIAPNERASWANLALMAMRRNELSRAQEHLNTALELDSTQSDILMLAAAHARMMGNEALQIRYLLRAVSADSLNARALFDFIEHLSYDTESLTHQLMRAAPSNTAVLLKKLEQSANLGILDAQILDALDSARPKNTIS